MSPRKCICHTAHTTSSPLSLPSHLKLFLSIHFFDNVRRGQEPLSAARLTPFSSILACCCSLHAKSGRALEFSLQTAAARLHQTVGQRKLGLRVSLERRWSVLGCSRARRSETAELGEGFASRRRERAGRGNASALSQFPKISDGIAIGSRFWARPLSHPSSVTLPLFFIFPALGCPQWQF